MWGIKSSKALPQVVAPPDLASDPHTRSSLESKSPARHSFLPNSGLPEEEERRRSRETSEEENVNQGVDVATTRAPELHRGVGSGKQSKKRRVSWTFNFAPSNSASPVVSELQEGGSSSLIDRCISQLGRGLSPSNADLPEQFTSFLLFLLYVVFP